MEIKLYQRGKDAKMKEIQKCNLFFESGTALATYIVLLDFKIEKSLRRI